MDINLNQEVQTIIDKFTRAGYQIYIVGGAVRDLLLKKEVKDWDFTTDATPEEILKIIPDGFYNNQFGTVAVVAGDAKEGSRHDRIFEITTMRKEGLYQDSRHPTHLEWTNNIEEDLARRDFTINAIALQPTTHNLIDPYNGSKDLQNKLIRAVGNPNIRFLEDALRLIRAVRLSAQLQFTIEEQTFFSIQDNAYRIQEISAERVRDEVLKILASNNPYEGILMLRSTGLLQYILPELEDCFGVVQEGPKHDRVYDIGEHSLLSLKNSPSPDSIVRFAILIHDIGKPSTKNVQLDGNVTFYGHDIVGAKIAKKICNRLHFSRKQSDKIIRLVRWHLFIVDEKLTDAAIRRFIKNIGIENIDDMMALRIADRLGGGTPKAVSHRMTVFRERINQVLQKPFSLIDLKVNGQDVMEILQIPPSRQVGKILDQLFQEVLEDASKNNREYLLEKIKLMA